MGHKMSRSELPQKIISEILNCDLRDFKSGIHLQGISHETEVKESERLKIRTVYIRTVQEAIWDDRFTGPAPIETAAKENRKTIDEFARSSRRRTAHAVQLDLENSELFAVASLGNSEQMLFLSFMMPSTYDYLSQPQNRGILE